MKRKAATPARVSPSAYLLPWVFFLTPFLSPFLPPSSAGAEDAFADAVVDFSPGAGGGFGAEALPEVVLGPPWGGGEVQQSLDVVSLGNGGSITLRFDLPVICDGPGPDLTVFENPFHVGSPAGPVFDEVGIVAVGQYGDHFLAFPYHALTHEGLAGREPVLSHPDNGVDPLDPALSGGDAFDLAELGLPWVSLVRIVDPGAAIADAGNLLPPGDKGGFDLDAVAALHACNPAERLAAEIFDGDGDSAAEASAGDVASSPAWDLSGDGRVTAADLVAVAGI